MVPVDRPIQEQPNALQKNAIIKLIATRFLELPRMRVILGPSPHRRYEKVATIVNWAYHIAERLGGIWVSSQGHTVMLYYWKGQHSLTWRDWLRYLRIGWEVIGLRRAQEVLRREQAIKARRADLPDYLYVWFMAQNPAYHGLKDLWELLHFLTEESDRRQLPILMETSQADNLNMYHRAGFEIYHHWQDPESELELWYMRRDPK